jgi:hypothetical protein
MMSSVPNGRLSGCAMNKVPVVSRCRAAHFEVRPQFQVSRMLKLVMAPSVAATMLVACASLPLDPATFEARTVQAAHDETKILTIPEGMVFYNAPAATEGLRFPPGTYRLASEDERYWYFRSAMPIEFRKFSGGKVVESHTAPGGIAIRKAVVAPTVGGAYIDGEGNSRTLVWKLGGEFLRQQGRYWSK